MNSPLRIGVLGLTHDHIWSNLEELAAADGAKLIAAADPHGPLREKVASLYECPVYEDYVLLLASEQLDAVYLYGDNALGVELADLAAARGLHILVEKPLANSLAGADRMLAAARSNNVRMMVNWPFAWWPQLQHAITLAAAGEIGDLWQVKYRAAHAGPRELGCSEYFCDWLFDAQRNGGGALIDYCCYGAHLARVLLGVPSRVSGTAGRLCKEDIVVEDNGVVVMSYPRAIAISEGSWTEIGKLGAYVPTIYGSRGTIRVEPRTGGKLWLATDEAPDGKEIPLPPQPPHLLNASTHFVHCLKTGEPFAPLCDDRAARDAQEILEAALRSSRSGDSVSLPLRVA